MQLKAAELQKQNCFKSCFKAAFEAAQRYAAQLRMLSSEATCIYSLAFLWTHLNQFSALRVSLTVFLKANYNLHVIPMNVRANMQPSPVQTRHLAWKLEPANHVVSAKLDSARAHSLNNFVAFHVTIWLELDFYSDFMPNNPVINCPRQWRSDIDYYRSPTKQFNWLLIASPM